MFDLQRKERPQPRDESRASAISGVRVHPQTAAAWARAFAKARPIDDTDPDGFIRAHGPRALMALCGATYAPEPLPPSSAFALAWPARCDAASLASWRAMSQAERDRITENALEYCRRWDEQREQAERARMRAEADRIAAERKRLVSEGGADVEQRASAYLAAIDGGPGGLWRAAFAMVCRFALGADAGMRMLEVEYVPRYHRKVARSELVGVVRRAARAHTVPGDLLEDRR